MLTHVLRQYTQSDRSEVVDRKAGTLGIVLGEQALPVFLQTGLLEANSKLLDTELLLHLLKKDLDKDTRAAGGVLLVHMHDRQRCPADAVG